MTRKLRIIFILTTCVVTLATGQVINSRSPDKTNMYLHGLDTVLRLGRKSTDFDKVIVRTDASILRDFPDSFDGVTLVKQDISLSPTKDKIKDGEVVVKIEPISIIRDEFKIVFIAIKKGGLFGYGQYVCVYKFMPETQTYELTKVKVGFVL